MSGEDSICNRGSRLGVRGSAGPVVVRGNWLLGFATVASA
jgi:hypothetical protein